MTKKLIFTIIAAVILSGMFLSSCDKNENVTLDKKGEINFSFGITKNLETKKTKSTSSKTDAVAVVVTIKTTSGIIVYDKKRLDFINFNGSFISQSLSLIVGDYQLTEFFVLDANNKTIYSTPIEGAPLANLVTDPLPINFTVSKDQVINIVPEVISTDCNCQANDFGYTSFDFVIVSPICFFVNVQVYNTTTAKWEVTTANVSIKGDATTLYSGNIAAKTDSLKVKDGYTNYIISISKTGYITKDSTLTGTQLKTYFNKPILFSLKPEIVPPIDPNGPIFNPNLTYGTMTDQDGNVYKTITIGTQTWMAENLRTTKYRNGDPITNVTINTAWSALSTGAYCWFNNDVANKLTYGALYNWFTVADSRNIAPIGWHVPTDAEWITLTTYLGGESVAGGKIKEQGTTHWTSPNIGATNESGFTALPFGSRKGGDGLFCSLSTSGNYWNSTQYDLSNAWARFLDFNVANCGRTFSTKQNGFAVRLLKN